MTSTDRPVKRMTLEAHDHRGKRLIIIVGPGDKLGFREERSRKVFTAEVADIYAAVVAWNVQGKKRGAK